MSDLASLKVNSYTRKALHAALPKATYTVWFNGMFGWRPHPATYTSYKAALSYALEVTKRYWDSFAIMRNDIKVLRVAKGMRVE